MGILDIDKRDRELDPDFLKELGFKPGKDWDMDAPSLHLVIRNEESTLKNSAYKCDIRYGIEKDGSIRISSTIYYLTGFGINVVEIPYIDNKYPDGYVEKMDILAVIEDTKQKMCNYQVKEE